MARIRASCLDDAWMTFVSKRAVAPSPSPAIFFARVSLISWSASRNASYSGLFSLISGFSAIPFASTSSVSFVEVSPSTEIILKVSTTSSFTAFVSSSLEITASVVTKASMVHILGWIMPEPLHIPPRVTVLPPISICTAASLFFVSVVMIALDALVPASRSPCFPSVSFLIPLTILSMGSCMPMTPVDATSTAFSEMESASAAAFAVCSQ